MKKACISTIRYAYNQSFWPIFKIFENYNDNTNHKSQLY